MASLFDPNLRAMRRDRAARLGPELFLLDREYQECLERIALAGRTFERALLIGCPNRDWPGRLGTSASHVEVCDPGPLFAEAAGGSIIVEDAWEPPVERYDLVLSVGTLDTVEGLPLALRSVRLAMRADGLFIGAMSGGDTLPRLREAMRAADATADGAAPHVHPRIEASALAPLLASAGFVMPVVDVERVPVGYPSFDKLVADLRAMAATNLLRDRPRRLTRRARDAAIRAFADDGDRTVETFEILHFAAWTAGG